MRVRVRFLAVASAVITAVSLTAGAFFVEIGKPEANPEAQAKHAVLVVRGYACHTPEKTSISATAEGLVNGRRESIPLKLIPLSGQSTYALQRQWAADGKWIVSLVEANPSFDFQPSTIVHVDGELVDWAAVTRFSHPPAKAEIEAALTSPRQNADAVASRF